MRVLGRVPADPCPRRYVVIAQLAEVLVGAIGGTLATLAWVGRDPKHVAPDRLAAVDDYHVDTLAAAMLRHPSSRHATEQRVRVTSTVPMRSVAPGHYPADMLWLVVDDRGATHVLTWASALDCFDAACALADEAALLVPRPVSNVFVADFGGAS